VIASLVFVLGVMVGKRVEARAHLDATPATSAALDPLAALDRLGTSDDEALAFPAALTGASDEPLGAVDEALEARRQAAPTPPTPADKAHKSPKAAGEQKPRAKAPKPAAKADAGDKAKKRDKPDPAPRESDGERPDGDVDAKAADADADHDADADADADERAALAQADKNAARFTLQLSSFQNHQEAIAFFQTLEKAGFSPYMVEAEVPGKGTWYRVRLGAYPSYGSAIDAKEAFEKKQQIIAYVTRIKS
jgi:cell division septation protein DedD